MPQDVTYEDYVGNRSHMEEYREYQKRYASKMRESDRVLIELVKPIVGDASGRSLLDIGCSTGNLLLHLKHTVPGIKLHGADLDDAVVVANRSNPSLSGIEFRTLDIVKIEPKRDYDVVTLNAILFALDDEQFELATRNVAGMLKPGGALIVFDMFHHFEQKLEIVETTKGHPNGLKLTFRPQTWTRAVLERAGLTNVQFHPFHMPFDLARSPDGADMTTYTRTDASTTERLSFRGALYQPWCHAVARNR